MSNELDMLQDDCNLDEIVDIDLDIDGKVMPEKNDKIALIDADTVAYTACLNTEVAGETFTEEFYTTKEWEELINDPQYDAEEGILYETCPIQALAKAEEKLNRILEKTGCQGVDLHFSGGRENFRYEVSPEYKANRTGRAPAGLSQLKKDLAEKYDGTIHTKWEADDAVVYLMDRYPKRFILCAIDKDVLNSIEGRNFNYYESALYNIEMKWAEVDRHTALTWRHLQTLMGDKTDNIIGLKGIGPAKAAKILKNCFSHKEMWEAVCNAYEAKGRTGDEALMNLNLVDMRLLVEVDNELEIKLNTHEELLNG